MTENLWFKNSVIYCLDLETFMDSNGDGIGDFEGLVRRLDYLHSLGVDTIWLLPFQPTPNRDNGYDICDYYGVDPRHGSSGDFVEFMHAADRRGIGVVIDLVINHTSDQHRWFQEARSDPNSRFRDWYVWSRERPESWNRGMIYPGVQEATWTLDEEAGEYFFHRFFEFQPDLNMENPAVRTEIRRIIGYWIQLGVAGFRVDSVPFMLEESEPVSNPERMFDFLTELRSFVQWRRGNGVLLAEANVLPEDTAPYFANGTGVNMMFNFYVNQYLFHALATSQTPSLIDALEATRQIPPSAQWVHFLRNHDELDLGRLTDEERAEVFARFGPDEGMQLYERGIRRRLAPMLGNRRMFEMAYSVMLSLPGTPMIYYGDEIGLGDDLSCQERDAVRTPMHWSNDSQAGFSTSEKLIRPVITDGKYSYERVNVAQQRRNPESRLNWTARMIRLRHECPEIGLGEWTILDVGSPQVLAIRYRWQESELIVLHNFCDQEREVKLATHDLRHQRLVSLLEPDERRAATAGEHRIRLDGYGYQWFTVRAT